MPTEERFMNEYRTVDENGMLIRVIEYREFRDSETNAEEVPGSVKYITEDDLTCKLLPDGNFQIVLDGRVLRRMS